MADGPSPERDHPRGPLHTEDAETVMEPEALRAHVERTYFSLRLGLALIAFALPFLLYLGAKLIVGVPLQASMSAYYHAGDGIMRNVFVGALVTVGAVLYLYKGFSKAENRALNLGGIFCVVVALKPTQWECGDACSQYSLHGTAAVLFFACIAYVCLFRAKDTLTLLTDQRKIRRYKRTYRTVGVLMVLSPIAAVAFSTVLDAPGDRPTRIFFIEAFAVWVFATYWFLKSMELRESTPERLVLEGRAARKKIPKDHGPDSAGLVRL